MRLSKIIFKQTATKTYFHGADVSVICDHENPHTTPADSIELREGIVVVTALGGEWVRGYGLADIQEMVPALEPVKAKGKAA